VAELVEGQNVSEAWFRACQRLMERGRRMTNLVVSVKHPQVERSDIRELVDQYFDALQSADTGSVDAVADTIFPSDFYDGGEKDAEEHLYARWRLARKFEELSIPNGDYFARMVSYPGVKKVNQLERVARRLRWAYYKKLGNSNQSEIALSAPELDEEIRIQDPEEDTYTMGFPCLSHISVTLEERRIHLSATYRSQDFALKAYGNYVGLSRLQHFLASESGFEPGEVVCTATCGTLPSRGQITDLLKECKRLLPDE